MWFKLSHFCDVKNHHQTEETKRMITHEVYLGGNTPGHKIGKKDA